MLRFLLAFSFFAFLIYWVFKSVFALIMFYSSLKGRSWLYEFYNNPTCIFPIEFNNIGTNNPKFS